MRLLVGFAALGLASGAHAACTIDAAGLAERHDTLAAERGALTIEARGSLATLRRTAERLEINGHDVACDRVVDAAMALLEAPDSWSADAALPPALGKRNLVSFAGSDQPVESTALTGRVVRGGVGEPLGVVDGVLLDQGRDASHLVVRHSAVWGDAREIAVPSARMLLDPGTGDLFAEFAAERLTGAPAYDRAAWDAAANDAWYDAEAARAVDAEEEAALVVRTEESRDADEAMAGEATPVEPPAARTRESTIAGGPKRIRVEKDRPERAQGSSD